VGSYFAVLEIRGVSPRIKIHHFYPSMDRSIRIVLELLAGLSDTLHGIQEVEGKRSSSYHSVCSKKIEALKKY